MPERIRTRTSSNVSESAIAGGALQGKEKSARSRVQRNARQQEAEIFCSSQLGTQDSEAIAALLRGFSLDVDSAADIAAAYDKRFGVVSK